MPYAGRHSTPSSQVTDPFLFPPLALSLRQTSSLVKAGLVPLDGDLDRCGDRSHTRLPKWVRQLSLALGPVFASLMPHWWAGNHRFYPDDNDPSVWLAAAVRFPMDVS
jgi:hypothetical protein